AAVAVHDDAGKAVAFAPDDAAKIRPHATPLAILHGLRDATLEKVEVEILPLARKAARGDLRLGIEDGAAEQAVAAVLERDDVAILRIAPGFQDFRGVNPLVSVENARAWSDDDSGHAAHASASGEGRGRVLQLRMTD